MKLIGKLDSSLVYEMDRGQYVIVDPDTKHYVVTWTWLGLLGRNFDMFMKCDTADEDDECLAIIEENLESIARKLSDVFGNVDTEDGQEWLKDQDEFYNALEDGQVYNWFD